MIDRLSKWQKINELNVGVGIGKNIVFYLILWSHAPLSLPLFQPFFYDIVYVRKSQTCTLPFDTAEMYRVIWIFYLPGFSNKFEMFSASHSMPFESYKYPYDCYHQIIRSTLAVNQAKFHSQ